MLSKGCLRVPLTAGRSNQSILKDINPEYSLEGLMLKLQYFGHLMRRADSLEKTYRSSISQPGILHDVFCINLDSVLKSRDITLLTKVHTVRAMVCHNCPFKEQMSFNFMAAVTIHSDFGVQENEISLFPLFPLRFAMKLWDQMP